MEQVKEDLKTIKSIVMMHIIRFEELEKEMNWIVLAQILNALALVIHIIWG